MTDTELKFLEKLHNAGIIFVISPVSGMVELELKEIPVFFENPDSFMAKIWGVPVEQFRAWREFAHDPHCMAVTKKGRPCSIGVSTPPRPVDFKAGVSNYCRIHQEHI